MDYDPSQQYRERHNASWDRIRHENASSVRSEPADPSYLFNSFDYNYSNFQEIPQQAVQNYVPQNHQLLNLDFVPIDKNQNQPIIDHSIQNQSLQPLEPVHFIDEEVETEEEDDDDVENSEVDDEEDDEIDRPDIYCIECHSKIEDTNRHDMAMCSRIKPAKLECISCNKSFNFEKNLRVHRVIEHLKVIDFVRGTLCPFCPKDSNCAPFSRFSAYIGHVKIHVKSDFLSCEQCRCEFDNEKELDRHIRREHSDDVYELVFCPKCQKVISLEESSAHYLLHLAQKAVKSRRKTDKTHAKPIPKSMLAKLNSQKLEKESHRKKAPARVKKYECSECPKAFVRPSELKRHAMIHVRAQATATSTSIATSSNAPVVPVPKWKCAICAKEYSHEAGLYDHKRVAHGNPKQIACQVCGLCFTKKSNHDRHMLKMHPLEQDSNDRDKFDCADCPTVYNTLSALTRHRRSCHNKTQNMKQTKIIPIYERYVCRTCKREFRDQKMLYKHRRLHLLAEHRWRDIQGGERKCDYCDKSFVLRASLVWHVQKHFEEQQIDEQSDQLPFCTLCDLQFFSQLEFRQHFDEQHSVVCGVCNQKFSSRQVYEDHICNRKFATRNANNQLVPSNRVIICRQCRPPQRLTTARQIKEHRARHLPRKTHLCWTCHKSFRTAQLLSLHAEVHDRQPVQCAHCPQVFHSRVALKQHTRISHGGDTNYQCVVHVDRTMAMSAQSFAEYGLVADHTDEQANRAHSVTEWMDAAVPEEDNVTQDDQEMRYHQPMITNNQNGTMVTNTNQGRVGGMNGDAQQPIRCEVCHHLYNNIELLCDHWQGSDTDTDHSYGIVTCPICESRIRGASEAANHLRSVHLFARPRILQFIKLPPEVIHVSSSSDCLALATIPATSSVTIQPSTSKKNHQCTQCSKIFTRKNDLDRHMKIHTGEKDFKCPTCSQCFRVKSTLNSHMETHSDNPPQFQCTVCQRAFYEKKTLVVHMRIHTGEQPFKCRFCDLHFRTPAITRTHEKKCAYGGPQRSILPDPSTRVTSSFQPQFVAPQTDMNRTITQISSLPQQSLQLSRNSAFNAVTSMGGIATSGDTSIFVITKPITSIQYIVIVQKLRPPEGTMRYAVDTVSEIKINQLQESTNLSIVLHNDMRLNLNTVKMLQMVPELGIDDVFKARVTVGEETQMMNDCELFSIIAHNKTSGVSSFIRRCEICEVDLPTKRASDAHFYSEDHETAQLMYPTKNQQPVMSVDRNLGMPNMMAVNAETSEFNCKLCGSRFLDMNSLLNHIRREHDEPVIPPRPVAHTAPIN